MNGLINVTKLCNLACKYCYAGNCNSKSDFRDVNNALLENMSNIYMFIDQLNLLSKDSLTILFHGGEPTLADVSLLRQIAEYATSTNPDVRIGIQTNGTILSEELIAFYKEFNISVGISLDGPGELNDINRIFPSGKGSYNLIIENIKKLQAAGVYVGTLATLTNSCVGRIEELYELNKSLGTGFSFNPLFIPETDVDVDPIDVDRYAEAVCRLFDLWIEDKEGNIGIKPFERIISGFLNNDKGLSVCSFAQICSSEFATIDIDGIVYPCNHLCGISDFAYGHISDIDLKEKMDTCIFNKRWDYLKENDCGGCDLYKFCFGGCPSIAHAQSNTIFCKDKICTAHAKILWHIYDYLERYKKK